eukprot:549803-Amphidinium_carterae.1
MGLGSGGLEGEDCSHNPHDIPLQRWMGMHATIRRMLGITDSRMDMEVCILLRLCSLRPCTRN